MREPTSPRYVHQLETQLAGTQAQIARLTENNDRLVETLKEARAQILTLKEEVDRLAQPPSGYGLFLDRHDDGTADVFTGGRELRVAVSPALGDRSLRVGERVLLNDALNIIETTASNRTGSVVTVKELVGDDRALVISHADEERVVRLAATVLNQPLRVGDALLVDPHGVCALERVRRSEMDELVRDEVPQLEYRDIGGLDRQIEQLRTAIELPFLHPDLVQRYEMRPPTGVLIHGPPGCGKTLIAKAAANSLARQLAQVRGEDASHFLNIRGQELLSKYVGETERYIRLVFRLARDKAAEGAPVIVFLDELDAISRIRGSSGSTDGPNAVVAQLSTELDDLDASMNVILVGASNRPDLIDPAVLRRLELKVKIDRPDATAAAAIFRRYLTSNLPIHPTDAPRNSDDPLTAVTATISAVVQFIYASDPANRLAEVTFESGAKEDVYFHHFMSGAIIRNVVNRAKQLTLLRTLRHGEAGIEAGDLTRAVVDERRTISDLTHVADEDDWSRISGARGERITFVRTVGDPESRTSGRMLQIPRAG